MDANGRSNLTLALIICLYFVSTYAEFDASETHTQPESYFGQLGKVSKILRTEGTKANISPETKETEFQAHFQELLDIIDLPKMYHKAKYLYDVDGSIESGNLLLQHLNKVESEMINSTCVSDIGRLITSLFSNETRQWAGQFFDATGKPGPSLTLFWLNFIGNYKQCKKSVAPPSSSSTNSMKDGFTGNYCSISLSEPSLPTVHVQLGVCVPSTCSSKEIDELVGDLLALYKSKNLKVIHSAKCLTGETEVTTATVFAVSILVIIGVLVVLGTSYDFFFIQFHEIFLPTKVEVNGINHDNQSGDGSGQSHNGNYGATPISNETSPLLANGISEKKEMTSNSRLSVCGKILLAFSLYTNGKKLLNTSQASGTLGSIHGIRFLSMSWVVLGHTFAFATANTFNLIDSLQEHLQRVSFDAIINALVSVDTFFTLSGLLTAYLTIKELKRKSLKINWFMYYFHRFWRLTPPYMLSILIVLGLQQYFGSGPFWSNTQPGDKKFCERNWWTNLLYVNNLVRNDEMCFGHSWYLANDMQFFLVSPLMIIPFYFHWAAGVASCTGFLLICWITTGVLSYQNDWHATILYGTMSSGHWFQNYYIAPWCRIGPYVVGVLAGYFLSRTDGKPFKMHWCLALGGWVVAAASALAVLYGLHGEISGHHILSPHVAALYNAVGRSVWGACVCWVIIACSAGYGGPINALLSWSPFVALGRLTYMTYLIHLSLLAIFFGSLGMPYYLNDSTLSLFFIGILVVANMVAFVFVLLFESPMIGLEKALWRK